MGGISIGSLPSSQAGVAFGLAGVPAVFVAWDKATSGKRYFRRVRSGRFIRTVLRD